MKKYNFKLTFENANLNILEVQDFLAEVETYVTGLDKDRKYNVSVIVAELKNNKKE